MSGILSSFSFKQPIRQLQVAVCDIVLFALSVATRLRLTSASPETALATMTRRVPWWVRGHLEMVWLLSARAMSQPLEPSDRARLRWCAEGARRLMEKQSASSPALYWEAEAAWGRVQMMDRRCDVALDVLTKVVERGTRHLVLRRAYQVTEDAAACAIAVGEQVQAQTLLNQIPAKYRSVEARSILESD